MAKQSHWNQCARTWATLNFEGPLELQGLMVELCDLYSAVVKEGGAMSRLGADGGPLFIPGSWPRLWFGDLLEYAKSPVRALTVSINPSGSDFAPLRANGTDCEERAAKWKNDASIDLAAACRSEWEAGGPTNLDKYMAYSSAFFRTGKPDGWFGGYRRVLRTMKTPAMHGIDYGCGGRWVTKTFPAMPQGTGVALHTDICSSYATLRVWSELGTDEQKELARTGRQHFSRLLDILRPNFILMSVSRQYWQDLARGAEACDGITVFPWKGALVIAGGAGRSGPFCARGWTSKSQKRELLGAWMGREATPRVANPESNDGYADFGHNSLPWLCDGGDSEAYDPTEG